VSTRLVRLEQLRPAAWNPRRIDQPRLRNLAESIKNDPDLLLNRPILAQKSGDIYAGVQRWYAAKLLFAEGWLPPWGQQTVPADVDEVDDRLARERAVRDNNTWGQWDDDGLAQLLGELQMEGSVLSNLGFDDRELAQFLTRLDGRRDLNPDDADLTPPTEPVTQRGDLWLLGEHRLLCGDSTKTENVNRLMKGERAILFATDPPYLVDYDGTNHPHKWGKPDGNKDWSGEYEDFDRWDAGEGLKLYEGFIEMAIAHAIEPNAAWYMWHASQRRYLVESVWIKYGVFVHQEIIWVKDRAILTHGWYMWQTEPCLFGWIRGKKPPRAADNHPTNMWEVRTVSPGIRTEHPTSKPVELFSLPLVQHTYPGGLCYDPFAGSGSQIIAAEQLGRRCFALEINPAYCDVTVRRWERVSGRPAVKADA